MFVWMNHRSGTVGEEANADLQSKMEAVGEPNTNKMAGH